MLGTNSEYSNCDVSCFGKTVRWITNSFRSLIRVGFDVEKFQIRKEG
jgi:hypothetical protein